MKVIYIAGKYRDSRGEWHAQYVWTHGGVALCPHLNTAFLGGMLGMRDEVWLEGDLELLRRCDAVWYIGYTGEESEEVLGEIAEAQRIGIPVLGSRKEVLEFLATCQTTPS